MTADRPGGRELRRMDREQLVRLGGELDGVEVVAKPAPPEPGTARGRRAERRVTLWFALSALSAVGFVAVYFLWPGDYVGPFDEGHVWYLLHTPMIGLTFGVAVLALGLGVIAYVKALFPDEVAVQRREGGPSDEVDRVTAAARLAEAGHDTGVARRPLPRRAALLATGLFGGIAALLAVGTAVRDPWKGGDRAALWVTGWAPLKDETVYLRLDTGVLGEIVRVRPEDLEPGAMMTVFPYRESDRGDPELLLAAEQAADTPVMLIRLRPGTAVVERAGQEDFGYGDYLAYSKICTHLGCPASLYDSQNNVTLCPCHQSAFLVTEWARPVFGPATRPLPQLPITVDEEGYFVARGDFVEPVGPAFWVYRSS